MARPTKCRRVAFLPGVTYFKPAGIQLRSLDEIRLSLDESEALRLRDIEGLVQEQGADKMNISRPTFQRVLTAARQKIADALLNGKAIRIEGGNFEFAGHHLRCSKGHKWELPSEETTTSEPKICPTCSSPSTAQCRPTNSEGTAREAKEADIEKTQ
jgi:predicted DNA-binding protein (UPF0251 family)